MYRQVIDGFALKTLQKMPNIPDFHLMVGSAEDLAPLPLVLYQNYKIPNQVINNMNQIKEMTKDEVSEAIENQTLEVNDMNWNVALLGGGLGGY